MVGQLRNADFGGAGYYVVGRLAQIQNSEKGRINTVRGEYYCGENLFLVNRTPPLHLQAGQNLHARVSATPKYLSLALALTPALLPASSELSTNPTQKHITPNANNGRT